MNPHRKSHRSGFTLTEVIVVAAIIGVLASLAFPGYRRIKALSQSTHCVSNLRQIGISLTAYLADHGMKLPELVPARESVTDDVPAIDTELLPYLNDVICFHCPGDHEKIYETTGTSYFWNSTLNGQDISAIDFLGISKNSAGIPLVADKEAFHQNVGDEVNILYVDGHVTKELKFIVDP